MALVIRQATSIDVGVGPFLDETDGKTIEDALTITQPDVRLKKNGGAWAQKAAAQTLTHEEAGWYEVTLDATDTDTVGQLLVAIHESGALPVWREFQVVEEAIYDALYAASANAFAGAAGSTTLTALASGSITAAVIATGAIDADAIADNAIDAGAIAADAITAAKIAAGAIDAATFAADVDAEILSYLVDDATRIDASALNTASVTSIPAILEDTGTTLDGRLPAALTAGGNMKADALALSGDTVAADNAEAFFDGTGYAGTNNVIPTVTTLTGHTAQTGDCFARLGAPAGASVSADIAAIEAQTDDIGAAGAGLTAVPWNASWDAEVQSEVADALEATIADSVPADGTIPSVKQALYMIVQYLYERSVSSTTVTIKKADGSTTLMQCTINDASTPTSITRSS